MSYSSQRASGVPLKDTGKDLFVIRDIRVLVASCSIYQDRGQEGPSLKMLAHG